MINFLEGEIVFKGERFVVLKDGGVGYKVFLPVVALTQARIGERTKLWTHLHVREDAMELYGFLHYAELEFFELLIGISGIGPRSALGVLALAPVDTLKRAIAAGDTSYLTKVSGIGRKTAEKIVLELKEKLGFGKMSLGGTEDLQHDADVLEALVALGYTATQARDALGKLKPTIQGREARLKEALKLLGT
ncbi:MAG TPA: Holliday junction branch migration protein RuvA [Candidatus Paceibacterota bacterium]